MKAAQIIITTIITVAAATAFGATKCDQKVNNGLFANTNPQVVVKAQVAKTGLATSYNGTR